jgi:sugar phosphate isomerase/epimerase
MPTKFSRRQFGAFTAATLGVSFLPAIRGNEPFKRAGKPRLHPGLAAYGFRDFFKDANHQRPNAAPADKQIDMFQFIDYCAEHDCAAEVTSYYFPANAQAEYFLKLKRHAFLRGVPLSGTAVGNTFTFPAGEKSKQQIESVNKWIDHAATMGVPHIRVFAGNPEGQTLEVAKRNCIQALEECCGYAGSKGVFLGIENHGGIVAEPDVLLAIVRAVNSPWLGINLDTGNFHTDDPYRDLERCAPYAVNVQVKTEMRARGKEKTNADLKRLVKILRDANYQGYVVLEYEAAENPYQAVPRILGELRALI